MSLLEEAPAPRRSAPRLSHYLLPGLVLLNLWLMLSLTGVLPVFFGDKPDPGRFERQVDAERVRILPAAMAGVQAPAGQEAPQTDEK
ncbi:MAG: hypothetical protein Q4D91_12255 [Lautropia sp.]|nr:hypothetical protein [Lautropia sp.]